MRGSCALACTRTRRAATLTRSAATPPTPVIPTPSTPAGCARRTCRGRVFCDGARPHPRALDDAQPVLTDRPGHVGAVPCGGRGALQRRGAWARQLPDMVRARQAAGSRERPPRRTRRQLRRTQSTAPRPPPRTALWRAAHSPHAAAGPHPAAFKATRRRTRLWIWCTSTWATSGDGRSAAWPPAHAAAPGGAGACGQGGLRAPVCVPSPTPSKACTRPPCGHRRRGCLAAPPAPSITRRPGQVQVPTGTDKSR